MKVADIHHYKEVRSTTTQRHMYISNEQDYQEKKEQRDKRGKSVLKGP